MAEGDHVRVFRGAYSHHGIDTGAGTVIHFTGGPACKSDAAIRETSLAVFADGGVIDVVSYGGRQAESSAAIVRRARARLGEGDYSLLINNCEHFATCCVTGKPISKQVETVKASSSVAALQGARAGKVPGAMGAMAGAFLAFAVLNLAEDLYRNRRR